MIKIMGGGIANKIVPCMPRPQVFPPPGFLILMLEFLTCMSLIL